MVVRVRDPESKKRSLLDAALTEFAARGLTATKVEAIGERAQCSTGLVYTYFGSKEGLFDAVLVDLTERTLDNVPIDPADLPGYAVALYDAATDEPEIERFVAWYQLERPADSGSPAMAAVQRSTQDKIAAVAAAQSAGTLSCRLTAAELVLSVQAVARMWSTSPDAVASAVEATGDREARRRMIHSAVALLVAES
jgi:AcrR family transcriptional regulator